MAKKKAVTKKTQTTLSGVIAGIGKLPTSVTALTILTVTYKIADLQAKLAGYQAVIAAAQLAHQQAKEADDAVAAIAQELTTFVAALKAALKAGLGRQSASLENVGISPDKTPAPLSPTAEATKVAKGQATRKLRNTMGSKQKAKVKAQTPPTPTATGH